MATEIIKVRTNRHTTTRTFKAKCTAYYLTGPNSTPAEKAMEGGNYDRKGNPLHTLQDFISCLVPWVSIAMDVQAFPYGTYLTSPTLSIALGIPILFRVVDTGSAFRHKGTSRIDICTASRLHSLQMSVNGEHVFQPLLDNTGLLYGC